MDFLIPSASARHRLAAARSRFGSDSSLNCHSLPNRHSASLHYLTLRGGFVLCGPPGGRPLRVDAFHFVGAHHDAPDKVGGSQTAPTLFIRKKRCVGNRRTLQSLSLIPRTIFILVKLKNYLLKKSIASSTALFASPSGSFAKRWSKLLANLETLPDIFLRSSAVLNV